MNEEEKELTLEELQEQLEALKAENAELKEQLEAPAEEVEEEQPEAVEQPEQPEDLEEETPEQPDDKETALQTRLEALWQREVKAELKEAGLEKFASFISVEVDDNDSLQAKVKELKALLEDYEVEKTYQPTNHTNTDAYAYALAKKNRNPREMLKARLG
ncbi:hypothetical protein [Carnobacterium sp. FSL W8-0810]|uniref:hypothetical protein n=1 Tax=Carnobacterium sp. FSL W8-0810 TaxID=2954705 RepID=UPI0030F931E4